MKIIFAILDTIWRWLLEYLYRALLLYQVVFYDNPFVKALGFLLICLDVYAMIDRKHPLKADVIEIMSLLIWTVCSAAYMISIYLPLN